MNIERILAYKIERTGMVEWIAQKLQIIREKPHASSYFDWLNRQNIIRKKKRSKIDSFIRWLLSAIRPAGRMAGRMAGRG